MFQSLPRVIKQPSREAVAPAGLEERSFTESLRRIPSRQVEAPPPEPPPEPMPVRAGVLRKQQTDVAVRPVALAETTFVPDYPLPAPAEPVQPAEPVKPPKPAPPSPEEIEAAWQARLDEAVALARREGFDAGVAAATAELEGEVAALRDAFAADLAGLADAAAQDLRRAEPLLAALAFDVAETILNAPLPAELRTVSERALADAVERSTAEPTVDVLLHPVDYLRLQEAGVTEQLGATHTGLRWHPNPDLKQGDWIVQSATATTRRLEAELLLTLRTRLGLGSAEWGVRSAE